MAGIRHIFSFSTSFVYFFKEAYGGCAACWRQRIQQREVVDLETVGSLDHTMPYNGDSSNVMRPRFSDVTVATKLNELPTSPHIPSTPVNSPIERDSLGSAVHTSPLTSPSSPVSGHVLWRNAVRNIKMRNAILATESAFGTPFTTPLAFAEDDSQASSTASPFVGVGGSAGCAEPIRRRTTSSGRGKCSIVERKRGVGESLMSNRARVGALVPRLIELEPTQDLSAHTALVRHMQFSPNGKFLATSSWDKTSVIFRVGVRQIDYKVFK